MDPYDRKPLPAEQQLQRLKEKGLVVGNEASAVIHLERIGYYRLKAYMLPFRNGESRGLHHATIESVMDLYNFDEALRKIVFSRIQVIETALRSKLMNHISIMANSAFWYLDGRNFALDRDDYYSTISKIYQSFVHSSEPFAVHFRERYYNTSSDFHRRMPPIWVAAELMTFGNLVTLLNAITEDKIRDFKLDRFSKNSVGPDKFKKLCNWMFALRDARNHCAHLGRIFNRNLRAPDGIKRYLDRNVGVASYGGTQPTEQLNRIYSVLCIMQVIGDRLDIPKVGTELAELFAKYPVADTISESMGFPKNWRSEPLLFSDKSLQ